jgi:hypothetical protein
LAFAAAAVNSGRLVLVEVPVTPLEGMLGRVEFWRAGRSDAEGRLVDTMVEGLVMWISELAVDSGGVSTGMLDARLEAEGSAGTVVSRMRDTDKE